MKIICTNKESCGLTREYESTKSDQDPADFCETCPECGSLAFIYNDTDKCIYNKNYHFEEINKLIIKLYFLTYGDINDPDPTD